MDLQRPTSTHLGLDASLWQAARLAGPRELRGTVVEGYAAWLRRDPLGASVLARLPAEVVRLVTAPPSRFDWVPAGPLDAVAQALVDVGGPALARRFGREVVHDRLAEGLLPLVRATLGLVRTGPGALFAHAKPFVRPLVLGTEFVWSSSGPIGGTLALASAAPVPDAVWEVWAGALHFAFDVCRVEGDAGVVRPFAGGAGARLELFWRP